MLSDVNITMSSILQTEQNKLKFQFNFSRDQKLQHKWVSCIFWLFSHRHNVVFPQGPVLLFRKKRLTSSTLFLQPVRTRDTRTRDTHTRLLDPPCQKAINNFKSCFFVPANDGEASVARLEQQVRDV